jgi:hypothetical protein
MGSCLTKDKNQQVNDAKAVTINNNHKAGGELD